MKIKYFNQFLYESLNISDTCTEISEKEAFDILQKTIEYFDGFNKTPLLYRGVRNTNVDYMIQDMSDFNRVSSFSKSDKSINLHNLYMSYDYKFKDFNRRNKSVIFSNNKWVARQYGEDYLVIPLNMESKISYVCTNDIYDIIDSPIHIEKKFDAFIYVAEYLGIQLPKFNFYTGDWNEFKEWLLTAHEVYDDIKRGLYEHRNEILKNTIHYTIHYLMDVVEKISEYNSMEYLLENYLFKCQNYPSTISKSIFNETYSKLKYNEDYKREAIELQTEDKCALIKLDSKILKKFIKR